MKKFIVLMALAGLAQAGAQQTVMDLRREPPEVTLPQNVQQRVLREVRAHQGLPVCEGGDVRDQVQGAFTRRGARQTAYLVNNCQALALDPSAERGRLVVYENGKIVRVLSNVGNAIGNVRDLNLDGVDELLFLNYSGPQMGQFTADASVVTLAGGRFTRLLDLPGVLVDTCATEAPGASTLAQHVTVLKGARPRFTATTYSASCAAPKVFRAGTVRRY